MHDIIPDQQPAAETFTCCTTPMPWPTRTEDRICPDCGTTWEREPVDLGAGARIKSPVSTPDAATHEGQLAGRVGELLPDLNLTERLELLGVMDPDDMRASLAWLAGAFPQMFDFALVRDRGLAGRLTTQLAEGEDDGLDDEEPYCSQCGAAVGIFYGHGDGWHHWRGDGTADSPVELFDAGHAPEVAWRPPACRVCGHRPHPETPAECAACPEGYCEARPAGAR